MRLFMLPAIAALTLFMGCQPDGKKSMLTDTSRQSDANLDVHSFARPADAVIRHLRLDLTADFDTRTLSGTATYDISVSEGASDIILDARDLLIREVLVDGEPVDFTLGDHVEYLGQPLHIP